MTPLVFNYEGTSVSINTEQYLTIGDNLSDELHAIARDFVLVARYLAFVNFQLSSLKTELDQKKGKRYAELKSSAYESLYGRKPTEDGLTHALNEDVQLTQLRKEILAVERVSEELYAVRQGLQMKADSLREISTHVRLDKRLTAEAAGA